jgi:hypothetical protein
VPTRIVLFSLGVIALLTTGACSPPDQQVLNFCRESATKTAIGLGMKPTDIGELVEACMSKHGFSLKKIGKRCSHDLQSQHNRRCYFPDTMPGHLSAALPEL